MKNNEMKLGLGIIAFDDTFHLKNIITEIKDLCDEIVICLQDVSWHGVPIDQSVVDYVNNLKTNGFIDDVIWFKNEKDYSTVENKGTIPRLIECDKRNYLLDFLQSKGCTHAQVIDSDEFYDHDDYKNALQLIRDNDIKVSYCEYINYYRDYTHLLVWPFRCYVPFVSDITYRFSFTNGTFDKPSDPTRRYVQKEGEKYCLLSFNVIKMHHLSWIRKNIHDKISNWSAKGYISNFDEICNKIIERYENYKDGQNAIIMFNVPENSVVVHNLNERYINPKYNLLDE